MQDAARVSPWRAFSEIDVGEWGCARRYGAGVLVLGEELAQHGGELVGALHVGQVSAIGEQRQPTCGQAVHRSLSLVDGEHVVTCAPDDQGRHRQGVELVEQDLTLPVDVEQGARHRGGGLELARPAPQLVLFGDELRGHPPRLGEQHRGGHGRAQQVAARHPAEQHRLLTHDRLGGQGKQGVDVAAQPCANRRISTPPRPPGHRAAVSGDAHRTERLCQAPRT